MAPSSATIPTLVQPGTITAVTMSDGAPFASIGTNGQWTGYEIALVEKIASDLGLKVTFTAKDFDTIIPSVSGGLDDIAFVSISDTDARRATVDFSLPDYTGTNNLVVLKTSPIPNGPQTSGVNLGVDKTGVKVGVIQSTLESQYAKTYFTGAQLVNFPNNNSALVALMAKSVDSLLIDGQSAYVYQTQYPVRTAFTTVDPANRGAAIVVNKKDTQLRQAINVELRKLLADGTIKSLLDKYDPKEPSAPLIAYLQRYYAKFPNNTYPY
jgi:polar amino acid transport system substrate-binding protein